MRFLSFILCFILVNSFLSYGSLVLLASKEANFFSAISPKDGGIISQNQAKIILSAQETAILGKFLDFMVRFSEGGYVLYGVKPMCVHGFNALDSFGGDSEAHRHSVYLKEGALLWKKIFGDLNKSSNILVHIYNRVKEDGDYTDILFINKHLFCQTVKDNITLFQYVLGPSITPNALLEKLIEPGGNFHDVLKNDRVLIGILLGYGVQNALHVSRIENLQMAYLSSKEQFPKKNCLQALSHYQDVLLLCSEEKEQEIDLNPSFSYSSLEEEIRGIIEKIECSSPKLLANKPLFIFGRLSESEESDRLVQTLEETQEKIIQLLASDQPLKAILEIIYSDCRVEIFKNRSIPTFELTSTEKCHLQRIVAKNIWATICGESASFLEGFYKGMEDADQGSKDLSILSTGKYGMLKSLIKAKGNVKKSDSFFAQLDADTNITLVRKGEVYYKVLQPGDGDILDVQHPVLIHCKAKKPNGELIKNTWETGNGIALDLSDTIPGFSWAIKGMQVGEIREIFIHPKMAYGIYTTLEKGIYLTAEVQLLSIMPKKNSPPFSPIESLNFDSVFSRLQEHNFEKIAYNEGYLRGFSVWEHYRQEDSLSLDETIKMIKGLEALEAIVDKKSIKLTDELISGQNLLNRLHWNIYHRNLN